MSNLSSEHLVRKLRIKLSPGLLCDSPGLAPGAPGLEWGPTSPTLPQEPDEPGTSLRPLQKIVNEVQKAFFCQSIKKASDLNRINFQTLRML